MIKKGSVVNLNYVLTNEEGSVMDQSSEDQPFFYLHGFGNIIPGLENGLEGLSVGTKKDIQVQPNDGYGTRNDDLIMKVPKTQFPSDVEIEVGMQFQSQNQNGQPVVFEVIELSDSEITVDGNHPMAGKTLNFNIEVLTIREATKDELKHGHVHGPGGHHH